jgi:hypothetical protein
MTMPLVPYVPHFSPLPRLTAVRREEVFIRRFFELVTMPADTYRRIETATGSKLVGDPGLWQPLLDELAAQIDSYGPGHPCFRYRNRNSGRRRRSRQFAHNAGFATSAFIVCSDTFPSARTIVRNSWRTRNNARGGGPIRPIT